MLTDRITGRLKLEDLEPRLAPGVLYQQPVPEAPEPEPTAPAGDSPEQVGSLPEDPCSEPAKPRGKGRGLWRKWFADSC
ncbi:MAG TPA: hypothetical protein VFP98_10360, partial [Candidatus Polarisedimenticolia bacterium]|nr:hypothetical protein [Candidatus Polarisedimenticolia bacterium]